MDFEYEYEKIMRLTDCQLISDEDPTLSLTFFLYSILLLIFLALRPIKRHVRQRDYIFAFPTSSLFIFWRFLRFSYLFLTYILPVFQSHFSIDVFFNNLWFLLNLLILYIGLLIFYFFAVFRRRNTLNHDISRKICPTFFCA